MGTRPRNWFFAPDGVIRRSLDGHSGVMVVPARLQWPSSTAPCSMSNAAISSVSAYPSLLANDKGVSDSALRYLVEKQHIILALYASLGEEATEGTVRI